MSEDEQCTQEGFQANDDGLPSASSSPEYLPDVSSCSPSELPRHPANAWTMAIESALAAQVVPEVGACTKQQRHSPTRLGNWTKLNFGSMNLFRVIPGSLIYCFASQQGSRQNSALESNWSWYDSLVKSSEFQGNDQRQVHLGPEAYPNMEVIYLIRSGAARMQETQPGRSLSFARMLLRFGLLQCTSGRSHWLTTQVD